MTSKFGKILKIVWIPAVIGIVSYLIYLAISHFIGTNFFIEWGLKISAGALAAYLWFKYLETK